LIILDMRLNIGNEDIRKNYMYFKLHFRQ